MRSVGWAGVRTPITRHTPDAQTPRVLPLHPHAHARRSVPGFTITAGRGARGRRAEEEAGAALAARALDFSRRPQSELAVRAHWGASAGPYSEEKHDMDLVWAFAMFGSVFVFFSASLYLRPLIVIGQVYLYTF